MQRGDRETKIPIDANTGDFGRSNDQSTWADYETALDAIKKFKCDGLGFYFKEPYIGIDIDDVPEDIERYKRDDCDNNIVSEFVDLLGSYAEISPSGKGIHIILKGELPPNGSRKGNIEMYSSGRFFTITGDAIGGYVHIVDDSDYGKINYLHNKYIARSEIPERITNETQSGSDIPDHEIIQIAYNSKNGMRFKLFMEGGWDQFYNSQSEADMAFSNDLAFWTNRDFEKMDRIFRLSSLYRDKWDEKRKDTTYGAETLNKAIADCTNVFSPRERDSDFNLYIMDQDTQKIERKFYSYDDTGNAQRFKDSFGEFVRYSYVRKNWYYYDGKIWRIDQEGKIKTLADKVIEKMKNETVFVPEGVDEEEARKSFDKHIKATRNNRGKTNMVKESEHLLPIQPSAFDQDIHLFNVQNGYIDLKTGTLNEHDKGRFFTKISNVEYTDKADCPLWINFLNTIFDSDQTLINYIRRAVGYSLSGSTEEQMMFILYGNGRNGKSVFLDIVTELFGNYAANIQPQTIMVKQQSSGPSSDIARLDGVRFVTTTEPNEGVRLDEGLVKQLTGGDVVTARRLHENEFEFTPQFKLWMATNHKPIIRGTDDGIWRRLAIIPFTVQIPEHKVDKKLTHKLRRELKAILHWAVEGYLLWKDSGLEEPQCIKDQRQDYRQEMDVVEAYIMECCYLETSKSAKSDTLYQSYREWARDNGQYIMSSTKFGKELGKRFVKFRSNGTYYKGITVKEEFEKPFFKLGY